MIKMVLYGGIGFVTGLYIGYNVGRFSATIVPENPRGIEKTVMEQPANEAGQRQRLELKVDSQYRREQQNKELLESFK